MMLEASRGASRSRSRSRRRKKDKKESERLEIETLDKMPTCARKHKAVEVLREESNKLLFMGLKIARIRHEPLIVYTETDGKEVRVSAEKAKFASGQLVKPNPEATHAFPITLSYSVFADWGPYRARTYQQASEGGESHASASSSFACTGGNVVRLDDHRGSGVNTLEPRTSQFNLPLIWSGATHTAFDIFELEMQTSGRVIAEIKKASRAKPVLLYSNADSAGTMARRNVLWTGFLRSSITILDLALKCMQHQLCLSGISAAESYLHARGLFGRSDEGSNQQKGDKRHLQLGTMLYTLAQTYRRRTADVLGQVDKLQVEYCPAGEEEIWSARAEKYARILTFLELDSAGGAVDFDEDWGLVFTKTVEEVEGREKVVAKFYITGVARLREDRDEHLPKIKSAILHMLEKVSVKYFALPSFNRWFSTEALMQRLLLLDCLGITWVFVYFVLPRRSGVEETEPEIWAGTCWINASNWDRCWRAVKLVTWDLLLICSQLLPSNARMYAGQYLEAFEKHPQTAEELLLSVELYPLGVEVFSYWSVEHVVHADGCVIIGLLHAFFGGWERMLVEGARYPFLFLPHVHSREAFEAALQAFMEVPEESDLLRIQGGFNTKVRELLRDGSLDIEYFRSLLILWKKTLLRTSNRSENNHSITSRVARKAGGPALRSTICTDFGAEMMARQARQKRPTPRVNRQKNERYISERNAFVGAAMEMQGAAGSKKQGVANFRRAQKLWKESSELRLEGGDVAWVTQVMQQDVYKRRMDTLKTNVEITEDYCRRLREWNKDPDVQERKAQAARFQHILDATQDRRAPYASLRQPVDEQEEEEWKPDHSKCLPGAHDDQVMAPSLAMHKPSGDLLARAGTQRARTRASSELEVARFHDPGSLDFYRSAGNTIFAIVGATKKPLGANALQVSVLEFGSSAALGEDAEEVACVEIKLSAMPVPVTQLLQDEAGAAPINNELWTFTDVEHVLGTLRFFLGKATRFTEVLAIKGKASKEEAEAKDQENMAAAAIKDPELEKQMKHCKKVENNLEKLRKSSSSVVAWRQPAADLIAGESSKSNQEPLSILPNKVKEGDIPNLLSSQARILDAAAELSPEDSAVDKMLDLSRQIVFEQSAERARRRATRQRIFNSAGNHSEHQWANPLNALNEEELGEHQKQLQANRLALLTDESLLEFAPGFSVRVRAYNEVVQCSMPRKEGFAAEMLKLEGLNATRQVSIRSYGLKGARAVCAIWSWMVYYLHSSGAEEKSAQAEEEGEPRSKEDEGRAYEQHNEEYTRKMALRIAAACRIIQSEDNKKEASNWQGAVALVQGQSSLPRKYRYLSRADEVEGAAAASSTS
ncbi:unnamed protein product [Amoebophrya sp. A25]|nr:unnamed protein product [Amoebophrya sp. A25]|eukprot:GSA25T00020186001.1